MGNCFSIPKSKYSKEEASRCFRGRWSTTRGRDNTDRLQLLQVPSEDSEDENRSEPQQYMIIRSAQMQSSTERRADESQFSEVKQLPAEAEQGPSSQISKNAQNEPQSFDDKGGSPIDKVQPSRKEQSPTDMPDSEQPLQGNRQTQTQTPTGNGNREQLSPRPQGKKFQEEFKKKAELVRPKITSNLKFNLQKPCSIHVLFTHEKDGSKVAGVVELRDWKTVTGALISKLLSIRKAVSKMGYDRVYAYLYVKEGANVSDRLKQQAEMQNIEIVRKDEKSPDELAIEIDKKLQSACLSDPTDLKNFDYTDYASATDHSAVETRLSDSDHAEIYNELKDHAAKWRDIGGALGFLEGELDNICTNQMLLTAESPSMSLLKKMLSQWLQWAPGDGRRSTSCATKESLVAALYKINLGQLAEKIKINL